MLQLDEDIWKLDIGNIGAVIFIRIGTEDAKCMAEEMFLDFDV